MKMYIGMLVAASLLITACGKSEKEPTNPPQPPGAQQQIGLAPFPVFNPKTMVTIQGQIINVLHVPMPHGEDCVQLIVRTNEGDIPVRLGPSAFVDGGPVQLMPLDTVTVKGSKLIADGSVFIVAQEITKGEYTLKLRDNDGNPLWSGWKVK